MKRRRRSGGWGYVRRRNVRGGGGWVGCEGMYKEEGSEEEEG